MNPDWQSIIYALLGGFGVTGIAKYFIQKSVDKIEEIPEKLSEIKSQIAAINVQLSLLVDLKLMVQQHDRILSALSAKEKFKRDCHTKGN